MLRVTIQKSELSDVVSLEGVDFRSISFKDTKNSYDLNCKFYETISFLNPPIIGFTSNINLPDYESRIPSPIISKLYSLKADSLNGYYLASPNILQISSKARVNIIEKLIKENLTALNPPYYVIANNIPIYLRNNRFTLRVGKDYTLIKDRKFKINTTDKTGLEIYTDSLDYFDFGDDNVFTASYTPLTDHELSEFKQARAKLLKKSKPLYIKETYGDDVSVAIGIDVPDLHNLDTASCGVFNKLLNQVKITKEKNFSRFKTISNKRSNILSRIDTLFKAKETSIRAFIDPLKLGTYKASSSNFYNTYTNTNSTFNKVNNPSYSKDLTTLSDTKNPSPSIIAKNNILEKNILQQSNIFVHADFIPKLDYTKLEDKFLVDMLTLTLYSYYFYNRQKIIHGSTFNSYSFSSLYDIPFSAQAITISKVAYNKLLTGYSDEDILAPLMLPIASKKPKKANPAAVTTAQPSATQVLSMSDFKQFLADLTKDQK